ncbi:MAG: hypothetical protein AMXMBFR20_01820 [Planctomycetia bacterium]
MKDDIDTLAGGFEGGLVIKVAINGLGAERFDERAIAAGADDRPDVIACGAKVFDEVAADEASSAGDECIHGISLPGTRSAASLDGRAGITGRAR